MNEFNRNLLIVLIAGAVSTSSYAMFPSQEDVERAEAFIQGQAERKAAAGVYSDSRCTEVGRSGLVFFVPDSSLPIPIGEEDAKRMKANGRTALEGTVLPGADKDGFVDASTGSQPSSKSGSKIERGSDASPTASTSSELSDSSPRPKIFRTSDGKTIDLNTVDREKLKRTRAALGHRRTPSGEILKSHTLPVELPAVKLEPFDFDHVKKQLTEQKAADTAGVGPLPKRVPSVSPEVSGELERAILTDSAARKSGTLPIRTELPVVQLKNDEPSDKDVKRLLDKLGYTPSWIEKIQNNKFKILTAVFVAADIAYAWSKTTKEELKDKTAIQQAKVVGEKTCMIAFAHKIKNGLNKALEATLNLKQRAQSLLNNK